MSAASQHWTEVLRTMTLEERLATPHAVAVRKAGGTDTFLYTTPLGSDNAEALAHVAETSGAYVSRWVALGEPEYKTHTPIPGWRQVTRFT